MEKGTKVRTLQEIPGAERTSGRPIKRGAEGVVIASRPETVLVRFGGHAWPQSYYKSEVEKIA